MKRREILQASFNVDDEYENRLLAHAMTKGNISKYLKRLILYDLEGRRESTLALHEVDVAEEDVSSFF